MTLKLNAYGRNEVFRCCCECWSDEYDDVFDDIVQQTIDEIEETVDLASVAAGSPAFFEVDGSIGVTSLIIEASMVERPILGDFSFSAERIQQALKILQIDDFELSEKLGMTYSKLLQVLEGKQALDPTASALLYNLLVDQHTQHKG